MTHNSSAVPRHHWLVRYYRAQFRLFLHVFGGLRIIPPPLTALGFAWLRRTQVPTKGKRMNKSIRSRIVIPAALVLGTALVVLLAGCGQRSTSTPVGPAVPGDNIQATRAPLEEWRVPVTADPRQYAIAFAQALWTYDTSKHSYSDWETAISMFPGTEAAAVARSMLPGAAEWRQLVLQRARAHALEISAATTPELEKLKAMHGLPPGFQAYVVRGKQTVQFGKEFKTIDRLLAVSVVCVYTCKLWSASAQTSL
ncbi:hypothetical protein ACIA49_33140 [Kribbella sp. NPDC051587]|uniref:hypothetical protein n=1 Tax=Kribbella sp. NPDC051587 TaxID=3364119 RepID=UPI0037B6D5F4